LYVIVGLQPGIFYYLHVDMPPKATPVAAAAAPSSAVQTLWRAYIEHTSDRLKFIDAFLVFLMLSGIAQFAYCVLVTTFPYNAFLSGCVESVQKLCVSAHCSPRFSSTVGQFVLTASLRSQVNPENKNEFKEVSPERCVTPLRARTAWLTAHYRAFADFAIGSIVLHFFVFNFLG
jgi:oligosaccharyltransferase complex subunit epsilon